MPRRCMLSCALVGVLACLALAPAAAPASQSDVAATGAYLRANFALVESASSRIGRVEATLRSLQHRIGGECPGAAANSPQDTDSEQLSNEVIGTMVLTADSLDLPAAHAFVAAVRGLHWSSGALTGAIHGYATHVSRLVALAVPKLCADVRSWAGSAFQALPGATIPFDTSFLANWVAPGDPVGGLSRFETGADRALAQRTARLENQVTELEAREVPTWGNIMNELELLP